MDLTFRLSAHATDRCGQRGVTTDDIVGALNNPAVQPVQTRPDRCRYEGRQGEDGYHLVVIATAPPSVYGRVTIITCYWHTQYHS